jgi:replicative DNA helicase
MQQPTPEITRALQNVNIALAQATSGVMSEIDALAIIQDSVRSVHVVDHELDAVRYLPENTPPEMVGEFSTGIQELDEYLSGGIRRGELCYVSGQKKRGKTTFLISLGAAALKQRPEPTRNGLNVVHATLEIYKDAVFQRYTENLTRKPITMVTEEDLHSIHERIHGQLTIVNLVHDRRVESLERVCEELHPDLLVVDYADCLQTGGDNRFSALGGVYEQLRVYAKIYDCGVWTASRLNNDGRDSESYLKGYACDLHVTLDVPTIEDAKRGIAYLDVNEIRRRYGMGARIQLQYAPEVAYIGGE